MDTQAIMAELNSVQSTLNSKFQTVEPFKTITKKANLMPAHVFMAVAALVLLLVSFDIGGAFFTTLIGFVFPAYCSIVAIESSGKNDDTQWLTYWVFFAGFTVIEKILDLGRHIPFYYLCKLLFFVWCMLPSTKGATVLYERFLQPLVRQYGGIAAAVPEKKQE